MNIALDNTSPLLAQHALLLYSNGTDVCLMQHGLSVAGDEVVLGAGQQVTAGFLKTLRELYENKSSEQATFLPPNLLAQGYGKMLWVEEACPRPLLFQGAKDKSLQALDGQSFPQPRLVFYRTSHGLRVFAICETGRPTPQTQLYKAPYLNFLGKDLMCNGNVKLPASITPDTIAEHVDAFFLSNFVHGSERRWAFDGSYSELWRAAAECGTFKDEWLRPADLTIAKLLEQ